jgi:hypothetical protein
MVPCLTAPLPDAKELLEVCAEAEIPAELERDACCGRSGCGCAPKMLLLVPAADVPRVAELLRDRWREMLEREGVDPEPFMPAAARRSEAAAPQLEGGEEPEHPPCPACGTAAPLVAGACSDCGLQLE